MHVKVLFWLHYLLSMILLFTTGIAWGKCLNSRNRERIFLCHFAQYIYIFAFGRLNLYTCIQVLKINQSVSQIFTRVSTYVVYVVAHIKNISWLLALRQFGTFIKNVLHNLGLSGYNLNFSEMLALLTQGIIYYDNLLQ